ncbi:type 1 fimbrial protein [Salmonella enterica]|nr:type 1 fimbrial protein [Salmonella enterica]EEI9370424.1 type 1 fimbrial protein [Salmonella enterica subsp. enterica serovar Chester]EHM4967841.1 type 1 fimbrial protein [Salmonella enterica]EIL6408546.1 type 1 fimbrial protein [Salmonella enterica]EIW6867284.1 type 1 fimbrial protein [Salmonella enterica]
MEKSMAGKKVAGTLLLAGLMMSAGAMAASGDPVTGGSGTVTINVPIVTSTCSVAVPTEVNFDPIDKQSIKGVNILIATKNMDITLSGCSGKTLLMSTRAHDISSVNSTMGHFSSGDPDHALGYTMYVPYVAEINGKYVVTGKYASTSMNNTKPEIIKPNSDSYVIASNILLKSTGNSVSNLGSAVSGGFDYTFTYQ